VVVGEERVEMPTRRKLASDVGLGSRYAPLRLIVLILQRCRWDENTESEENVVGLIFTSYHRADVYRYVCVRNKAGAEPPLAELSRQWERVLSGAEGSAIQTCKTS
jgi:hypothetical protein